MLNLFLLKPGQSDPIATSVVEDEVEATQIAEAESPRFLRIINGDGRPLPSFRRLLQLDIVSWSSIDISIVKSCAAVVVLSIASCMVRQSFQLLASPVNAVLIKSRRIRLAAVEMLEGIDRLAYSVSAE